MYPLIEGQKVEESVRCQGISAELMEIPGWVPELSLPRSFEFPWSEVDSGISIILTI